MKKVLITGANSYIGQSVENWLLQTPEAFTVDTLDMVNPKWREFDFTPYDCIFHVAAIVHKNEKNSDPNLYHKVNTELPIELATVAKEAGVGQFLFLSSMSVYGNEETMISGATKEKPSTYYGKSKLAAEIGLKALQSDTFKVLIMRPPMVYGPKATGNYTRLSKLSKITPLFPKIDNQRSMIFIDNLAEFVKLAIDHNLSGLHYPQNSAYVNTSELVKMIRKVNGKNTVLTSLFNPIISKVHSVSQINKLFGSLTYDQALSQEVFDYNVVDYEGSIRRSEGK
ncbi:UDP-glucose 4-epimerase [Streptococcus pseudoporcinus]|uniref:UDP-glucose 4-epimerase n=1 Tax=Streptococcus pseudoporcinus TaxID=361101 RepID=A0A4U9YL88_9STRE|nr:NAD-dependent epimerase/dehydratase family protein [Streptococcus pseudoporcinus]VTS27339.1 UDP-glucose 4-epimerase [Streptococcus pseudoporcinus]